MILLQKNLDDYATDTKPVRVVDAFVDELDLRQLGFEGVKKPLLADWRIIRRLCQSFTFAAIPIAFNPAGFWRKKRDIGLM